MQDNPSELRKMLSDELMTVLIRIGLIAFLVVMCARIFAPFASTMLWALILAVVLYPMQLKLAARLGGRQGRAATVLVIAGLLVIGVPTVLLGGSFAAQLHDLYQAIKSNSLSIPEPSESIAGWPLIGPKIHATWASAANDLPALIESMRPQLREVTTWMLETAAGTAGNLLLFLASMVIAGIMLAYGAAGSQAMLNIGVRLAGEERGQQLHKLSTATVRSVASGVVGVAFIQALVLGVIFMIAGIPGAGLLAILALLLGIAQVPALVITIPVIAYVWIGGEGSSTANAFYTVLLVIGTLVDNVLKPLLLGRGVDAPMPVVLIGALGGMITGGILGLFLGAVILAAAYQLFMGWVARPARPADAAAETPAIAD